MMSQTAESAENAQIASEIVRMLRDADWLSTQPQRPEWIGVAEAAAVFGYSTSRFYHVYEQLGLVPSRMSKRKLMFRRIDVERTMARRQIRPAYREKKIVALSKA